MRIVERKTSYTASTTYTMDISFSEIQRLLGQNDLSKSDVVNLMTQLRICLESADRKQQFRYLNMYCNWTVHPQLSQSAPAFEVLESLADTLVGHPNAPGSPGFFKDVTKSLLFDELRDDCRNFATEFAIPVTFCTDAGIWYEFVKMIISILLERTLEFPDPARMRPNVRAIYDRIEQKWTQAFQHTTGVRKFSFVLGEGEHKNKVMWSIELIPGSTCIPKTATLRGPLMLTK